MEQSPVSRQGGRLGAVVVAAVFVASRLALAQAGMTFDTRPIHDSFALADPALLRDELFATLANLHVQPPLFNLVVGLGLRLGPGADRLVFHLAFLVLGLVLALGVYSALVRVGAGVTSATIATVALVLSPSVFLYEHWFHYDYPVAVLLCVALVVLQRYAEHRRPLDAGLFLALLAAVALTRSMFHLGWLVAWAVVLVVGTRRDPAVARWRVAAAAVVAVTAVAGTYVNTLRVSGQFTSSTTLGISLAKITTFQLDEEARRQLVAEGELSPLALVPPASPLPLYGDLVRPHPPSGLAVLDEPAKGGAEAAEPFQSNFNNLDYVELSDRYLADAVTTVQRHPEAYLRGVVTAVATFFQPPSGFFGVVDNRRTVAAVDRAYNVALLDLSAPGGQPVAQAPAAANRFAPPPVGPAWLVVVAYALALVGGGVWSAALVRRRQPVLVVAFLWSTIAYVFAVGNLLEVGENNRFRLYSDPLLLVLVVAGLLAWRRRRSPGPASTEAGICHAAAVPVTADRRCPVCPGR